MIKGDLLSVDDILNDLAIKSRDSALVAAAKVAELEGCALGEPATGHAIAQKILALKKPA